MKRAMARSGIEREQRQGDQRPSSGSSQKRLSRRDRGKEPVAINSAHRRSRGLRNNSTTLFPVPIDLHRSSNVNGRRFQLVALRV
jgi:hypothetical protein